MKKISIMLTVVFVAAVSQADLLASEDFTYSDGTLEGNGVANAQWSAAWDSTGGNADELQIVSGKAVAAPGTADAKTQVEYNRTLTVGAIGADAERWVGFDFTLDNADVALGNGDRLRIGMSSGSSSSATLGSGLTVIESSTVSGQNNLQLWWYGTSYFDTGIEAVEGTTYRVAVGITTSSTGVETGSLYINGIEKATASAGKNNVLLVDRIIIGSNANSGDENLQFTVDNMLAGETYTDVVPEPAVLGLVAFAGVGMLVVRRFISI